MSTNTQTSPKKPLLKVDFSHRIEYPSESIETEFLDTAQSMTHRVMNSILILIEILENDLSNINQDDLASFCHAIFKEICDLNSTIDAYQDQVYQAKNEAAQ